MNEQPSTDVERLLATGSVASADDWRRVKDYLATSLAAYLGREVEPVWEPVYEDISPTGGFSFGVRSREPLGGPLGLEWYGVVSHSGGRTDATVLLFARDERVTSLEGQEFLSFEFARTGEGVRQWQSRGWASSEMGEWEGYQRLSEACRQMGAG